MKTVSLRATLALAFAATAHAAPVINEIRYRPGSTYPENQALIGTTEVNTHTKPAPTQRTPTRASSSSAFPSTLPRNST